MTWLHVPAAHRRGAHAEQRAFRLVTIGGGAATVAVVGVVLAIVGILGWWLPILAIIVAAICGLLFRRTVS